MRLVVRYLAFGTVLLFTLVVCFATGPLHKKPRRVSIVIVPSPYDGFLVKTGNVKVTFRDGQSELWTHTGDCYDVKVSPSGSVGWIRMDKKSVDTERLLVAGKDILVIRPADGTSTEFAPYAENVSIMDWRFADGGLAVVVRSMGYHGPSSYVKYQIATRRAIDVRGPGYTPYDQLPSWAKPLADPKLD